MTFKVLVAVLAICVAQNAVNAGALVSKDTQEVVNKNVMPQTFGWFGNNSIVPQTRSVMKCMSHMGSAWTVYSEAKTLAAGYVSLKKQIRLLKENCDKFPTEESKLICKKNVDEQLMGQINGYIQKVEQFWPKIVDITKKFRDCLFD